MCGRFVLSVTYRKLAEHFDLMERLSIEPSTKNRANSLLIPGELDLSPSWNIAPSTRICSISADPAGGRHLLRMRWGLIPSSIGRRGAPSVYCCTTDRFDARRLSNAEWVGGNRASNLQGPPM